MLHQTCTPHQAERASALVTLQKTGCWATCCASGSCFTTILQCAFRFNAEITRQIADATHPALAVFGTSIFYLTAWHCMHGHALRDTLQVHFKLAKPGLMKAFEGKWTVSACDPVQPLAAIMAARDGKEQAQQRRWSRGLTSSTKEQSSDVRLPPPWANHATVLAKSFKGDLTAFQELISKWCIVVRQIPPYLQALNANILNVLNTAVSFNSSSPLSDTTQGSVMPQIQKSTEDCSTLVHRYASILVNCKSICLYFAFVFGV